MTFMSAIIYFPNLLTSVHHCKSSPDSNHRNLFGCKSCICKRRGSNIRGCIFTKKKTQVSNHTLVLTVSTEIYCTLQKWMYNKGGKKKKGSGCASNRKMLMWWKTNMQWHENTSIAEYCVLEHWTCFISELFTIYLNISHIQNRYNRLCGVICLREREREKGSGQHLKKKVMGLRL